MGYKPTAFCSGVGKIKGFFFLKTCAKKYATDNCYNTSIWSRFFENRLVYFMFMSNNFLKHYAVSRQLRKAHVCTLCVETTDGFTPAIRDFKPVGS